MASPIAGPSRIPLNVLRRSVTRARIAPSSRFASSSTSDEPEVDPRTAEAEAGYQSWIKSSGRQYESVRKGQRAQYLGGSHVSLFYLLLG
jgi:hypothetical protein